MNWTLKNFGQNFNTDFVLEILKSWPRIILVQNLETIYHICKWSTDIFFLTQPYILELQLEN